VTLRGAYKPRVSKGAEARAKEDAAINPVALAIAEQERALAAVRRHQKIRKARELTVEGLQAFIELCMPDPEFPDDCDKSLFQCKPHHRVLMEMVVAVASKKTMRAACSMPPQHGKSLILSRFGLAWIMGHAPHMRILFATYAATLASTRGDEVRTVIHQPVYREIFPKAIVGTKSSTVELTFTAGGSINFVGRGTATTGRPADLFIIDDPYANEEEGSSEVVRASVKEWYSAVVFSRCHVLTPILIVHTRWSEDDLLGWLTDPEHPDNRAKPERVKRWKYVNLPTPVDDPSLAKALGLAPGAPLWEERFPLHHLKEAEENDPRIYAALYRGQPSPADGDFFKAEHIITYLPGELPKELRYYAASDHAVSEKQRADLNCFGVVGVCPNDIVWIMPDLYWQRADTMKSSEAMIDMMARWKPLWWRAAADHISKSVGPFLKKRMLERQVFCNIVESPEAGDKLRKAQAIQARMSMGRVRFPAGAPWLMRARAEMLKFPHGAHDDFVDMLGHVGRGLRVMHAPAGPVANDDDRAPVPGTFGWIKWASQQDRRGAERAKRLRSM